METMQQPKITGYRQLNEDEANLMNAIKALGGEAETLMKRVDAHLSAQAGAALNDTVEQDRIRFAEPHRWKAISKTHLQEALMALTRSVAQPSSF